MIQLQKKGIFRKVREQEVSLWLEKGYTPVEKKPAKAKSSGQKGE